MLVREYIAEGNKILSDVNTSLFTFITVEGQDVINNTFKY